MQSTKQFRLSVVVMLAILLLVFHSRCGETTPVDGLDTWHLRDAPLQPNDVLTAVAFGAETFVAVGYEAAAGQGIILTSSDGANWSRVFADVAFPLYGVSYGNGLFVAVGAGTLFTSPDGINWTQRFLDLNYSFHGVSFFVTGEAKPLFMAVGWGPSEANPFYLGGAALVSSDGIAWTSRELAAAAEMAESVAFGQGTYVVVTHPLIGAEYHFHTSADSIQWTSGDSAPQKLLFGVLFALGRFIAVGGDVVDTTCLILTSSNGASWTPEIVSVSGGLRSIAYGMDTLVAVGQGLSETSVPFILTSTERGRWTQKAPLAGGALLGIAFGGDTFVAVGSKGTILQSDRVSPHP